MTDTKLHSTDTENVLSGKIKELVQELSEKNSELRVEAALQRVLDKTVAMTSSHDIADATSTFFDELVNLGVGTSMRGGISVFYDSGNIDLWTAIKIKEGEVRLVVGKLTRYVHPLLDNTFMAWLNKDETLSMELNENDLRGFYTALNESPLYPFKFDLTQIPKRRINNTFFFPEGALYAYTDDPLPESAILLFRRFANAFSLTYRRYLDLKHIEEQSTEAMRQAAINRVRAETASMRTTNDLERITPMLWSVLQTLGVPFIRCGVFIMSEEEQQLRAYLSTPDGKAIASFHTSFDESQQFSEIIGHWRKKEIYRQHWNEEMFAAWAKNLVKHGFITSTEEFTESGSPISSLYLHFIPFSQGMLYIGSLSSLEQTSLQLVQNLADAFSTAYARYEDFSRLEMSNNKLEATLKELKTAQAQLVQSEKMASLGELTAGIAHEIQNPLNFINNFSEINNELIDEMNEEGDAVNVKEIGDMIRQNNEKIIHHGRRADAIVKSMLQHSRKNTGQQELTDINALCDEYLRLSYHGLRAKDKSFNAELVTDFDSSIGMISIIPQDIGRVLLNLLNNAFYAVNEKKKLLAGSYQPMVKVVTKKANGATEIRIEDNGDGIPAEITERIFQPFFTTKPTGQGTGLGLSLVYDIITKEHKGTIRVESEESEGSRFIIVLPNT